jgi:hypothetical protein
MYDFLDLDLLCVPLVGVVYNLSFGGVGDLITMDYWPDSFLLVSWLYV